MSISDRVSTHASDRAAPVVAWRLGVLFGSLYFLQGIGEPTDGRIAQPVRSLLKAWGRSAGEAEALGDVVTDALMIERGQPLGLTGPFQAVQWGCLYAAGIVTGLLGGALCEGRRESWAFLICGVGGALTLALALFCVREPVHSGPRPGARDALAILSRTARRRAGSGSALGVGGFLFLWNFNPFSKPVPWVSASGSTGRRPP